MKNPQGLLIKGIIPYHFKSYRLKKHFKKTVEDRPRVINREAGPPKGFRNPLEFRESKRGLLNLNKITGRAIGRFVF